MKHLIFLLFIICTVTSVAQERLQFGPSYSIPVGAFASDDLSDGGFAQPGWGFIFENKSQASFWPEQLYFLAHLSYHSNDFDRQKLESAFNQAVGTGIVSIPRSGSYQPLIFTIGPSYEIDLTPSINLDLRGGLGVMFVNIDPIRIDVTDNGTLLFTEVIDFEGNPNFTYQLGTNIDFSISQKSKLVLGAYYASANEGIDLISGSSLQTIVQASQKINYIAISLALSLQL